MLTYDSFHHISANRHLRRAPRQRHGLLPLSCSAAAAPKDRRRQQLVTRMVTFCSEPKSHFVVPAGRLPPCHTRAPPRLHLARGAHQNWEPSPSTGLVANLSSFSFFRVKLYIPSLLLYRL